MHIRAFVGAAVLGLAMLAFAPAMAMTVDEPPDICVLDLSAPPALDAVELAAPDCSAITVADVRFALDSTSGDEGDAAWPSCALTLPPLDLANYRLHVDPGRCPA